MPLDFILFLLLAGLMFPIGIAGAVFGGRALHRWVNKKLADWGTNRRR